MSSSSAFDGSMTNGLTLGRAEDRLNEARQSASCAALDDAALIHLVQTGHRDALGVLFDRYAVLIHRVGTRILRDPTEAQDLVQEVFLYVHRKSHVFDPAKGQLLSWLVQISYSRAFSRRERLRSSQNTERLRIEELAAEVKTDSSLEVLMDDLAARDVMEKAFTQLSDLQRETLRMYFFEGYSLREIAERLNQSFTNTRHHYYRGIEKLKDVLKPIGCR